MGMPTGRMGMLIGHTEYHRHMEWASMVFGKAHRTQIQVHRACASLKNRSRWMPCLLNLDPISELVYDPRESLWGCPQDWTVLVASILLLQQVHEVNKLV